MPRGVLVNNVSGGFSGRANVLHSPGCTGLLVKSKDR